MYKINYNLMAECDESIIESNQELHVRKRALFSVGNQRCFLERDRI